MLQRNQSYLVRHKALVNRQYKNLQLKKILFLRISMIARFFFLITFLLFKPGYAKSTWMKRDDPGKLITEYESNISALPIAGKLKRKPWSGDYWATYRGGITFRWLQSKGVNPFRDNRIKYDHPDAKKLTPKEIDLLSPAEKFDLYKGDYDWTLTKLERKRTKVMTKKNIPTWWGLCHAWAPATILYNSPNMINVKGKNGEHINFYASDIKALLTYNLHLFGKKKKSYFLGSRCNVKFPWYIKLLTLGLMPEDVYLSTVKNERCNDMNPGAVHIALTNMIGLKKEGFVMDKTRGSEVWNQGVYAYKSKFLNSSKRKKLPLKGLNVMGKVHKVKTTVTWVTEIRPVKQRVPSEKGLRTIVYKYDIYTDDDGDIVGGKWRQFTRPDFFWRIDDPGIHDMMVGLQDIYSKSIEDIVPTPKRRRTRPEFYNLFKKTARQVMNSQAFIKNTQELVAARKADREEYYRELKDYYLKNYKKLKKRYRR